VVNVENFHHLTVNPVKDFVRVANKWHDAHGWALGNCLCAFRPRIDARFDGSQSLFKL
jgi:hypothetical protein